MNRQEHLLTCLGEECNEVAKRVSKALRFGLGEVQEGQLLNNAKRIEEELKDLWAVVTILTQERVIYSPLPSIREIEAKRAKIERYMKISREQGVLSGETA